MDEIEAVAEAWASIDGRLDAFRAEKALPPGSPRRELGGRYDGYMDDAAELLERLKARGYVLSALPEPPAPAPDSEGE